MTMPSRKQIHPVLLRVLAQLGGRARPRDIIPEVTKAFPDLTEEDLKRAKPSDPNSNMWENRVHGARQDLVQSGRIGKSERGWWALAEAVDQPSILDIELDDEPPQAVADSEPPTFRIVADPTEAIAVELEEAGRDSQSPSRLEEAVKDAMEFLGFEARKISGSGETDVLAEARLGKNRYTIVLDAKSTASGNVAAGQVDMLSIKRHRESHAAHHACVVGPGFAGGELRERAIEFDTSLLTTTALAELVRLHGSEPATLTELRAVFQSSPMADDVVADVRSATVHRAAKRRLLLRVIELIEEFNHSQPDVVLANPHGILAATVADPTRDFSDATPADVEQALELLSMLGVISPTDDGGYLSETSQSGALDLLRAFGSLDGESSPTPQQEDSAAGSVEAI